MHPEAGLPTTVATAFWIVHVKVGASEGTSVTRTAAATTMPTYSIIPAPRSSTESRVCRTIADLPRIDVSQASQNRPGLSDMARC